MPTNAPWGLLAFQGGFVQRDVIHANKMNALKKFTKAIKDTDMQMRAENQTKKTAEQQAQVAMEQIPTENI